jgi:hypothetical protein
MNTQTSTPEPPQDVPEGNGDDGIKVWAPITDEPLGGPQGELIHAALDPADSNQAVLHDAPFFVDWLNYGDLVRVGPEEDGARPILEVVEASGHRHIVGLLGRHSAQSLSDRLDAQFLGQFALRMEGASGGLISVSVHPDTDPEDVLHAMADWLDEQGAQDDDDVALSPVFQTRLGPVTWPTEGAQ